jgi:predicted esterase
VRPIHEQKPVLTTGRALDEAAAAMVMIHGRGATAESILELAAELPHRDFAYVAPQAAGGSWYPKSFLAPVEENEPKLTSALASLDQLMESLGQVGLASDRIVLLGFSQGACLALEFAATRAQRYGAVVGLSGGLIGPPGSTRKDAGDLAATPVFLGCSPRDPHVPAWRVDETAATLAALNGRVGKRFYPELGHAINRDELEKIRSMMAKVGSASTAQRFQAG